MLRRTVSEGRAEKAERQLAEVQNIYRERAARWAALIDVASDNETKACAVIHAAAQTLELDRPGLLGNIMKHIRECDQAPGEFCPCAQYIALMFGYIITERNALRATLEQAWATVEGADLTDIDQRDNATPDELRSKLLGVGLLLVEHKAMLAQARDAAYRACKEAVYAVFQEAERAGLHVSVDDVMSGLARAYKVAALDAGKETDEVRPGVA